MSAEPKSGTGLGVDSQGGPVVDPTVNVLGLVAAAVERLDDLRILSMELANVRVHHQKEISDIRDNCNKELSEIRERHAVVIRETTERHTTDQRRAEAQRLDSIRQVDREDVNKTAAAAQTAIAALANNTTTLAETLRNQVQSVANAAEIRRTADNQEIIKRLSALELSYSEGRGKQAVVDPQVTEMIVEMRALRTVQAAGIGKTEGVDRVWVMIAGVIAALASAVAIGMSIYAMAKR